MTNKSETLAEVVARARTAKGLSTRQLASEIGIDQSNIVRLEQGSVAEPKPTVLEGLARVLDLELADLYALAGYTKPTELPAFTPYLRSKFTDLPPQARAELAQSFNAIATKYGYDAGGPAPGQDEN
ncbi:XRE family transcriptional regulator [Nocardioides glacieisoli]|uniref:XRE family transcriptional regulator n=1 Tax=Nocardioides glacieisoli TaxID=1168730 RepID=A0A4V1RKA3_9ACTN|nr:helix-turn-helix transcriptional regulator [Nocardioides glacieisoli]RYB91582.1 XRE family transcriptional regulator [Nocardioides glacieisoli]